MPWHSNKVNIFYSCAQNGYNQKWDFGLDHTYPFLFESVTEIFISGLAYPPHVTGETGHRKRNFWKMHFRVEVFENAGFSFKCGRTKTEVIRLRWWCHTSGAELCWLHIALRMLRKGEQGWPGSWDGAVVRALAFHQCGRGSIPGLDVICGLSLLLVLFSAPRGFSPGTPVFPSPQKPTFLNSNSIRNARAFNTWAPGSGDWATTPHAIELK